MRQTLEAAPPKVNRVPVDFPRTRLYGAPLSVEAITFNVDEIEESGDLFEADLSRAFIDGALRGDPPTEFHAGGAAHLRAKVTKLGRKVLLQTRFTVPLEGQCKRCLDKVRIDEPVDLTLTFVPGEPVRGEPGAPAKNAGAGQPAASFDPETVDEEPYSGKVIDLSGPLREQILLAIPPAPLCDEACKGLCPQCGKDLNQGDCGCERKAIDPRWAALKTMKLQKKEK
jgi:uncharacterized protein